MQPDAVIDGAHLTLSQLKERGAQVMAKFHEAKLAHATLATGWQRLQECPQMYYAKLARDLDHAIGAVAGARSLISTPSCNDFDRKVFETKLKYLRVSLLGDTSRQDNGENDCLRAAADQNCTHATQGNAADCLTRRECVVLKCIAEGHSTKQVATALGITFKTAACHRYRVMDKLDIHDTASLVRYAIRNGFIQA